MSTPGPEDSSICNLLKSFNESINLSRLPVPEPPQFGGDPLQYTAWKASFGALIESRRIPASERMHYMKQYLKGEAREAVEALFYFDTETAYSHARQILEERYGNPFLIAEAFRDKLDAWPRVSDSKGLRRLADFLRQCQTAMLHIQDLQILNDCRENRKLLQKLPEWVVHKWSRIAAGEALYPTFDRFATFLSKEADIACNPITNVRPIKPRQEEPKSN